MARTDANPPMPEWSTEYQLVEVDADYLGKAVKPKQFIHIDQSECIMCEGSLIFVRGSASTWLRLMQLQKLKTLKCQGQTRLTTFFSSLTMMCALVAHSVLTVAQQE